MSWQSSRTDRFKSLFNVFAADLPYPQRVRLVFQLLDTANKGRFRLKDLQEHADIFAKELGVQFTENTFATVDLFRAIDTRDQGSISCYELSVALIMHWEGRTLSGTKKVDFEQLAEELLNDYSGSMTRHEVLQCIKNRDGPADFLAAAAPFAVNIERVLKSSQLQEVLKIDSLLGILKEAIAQACEELKQDANITLGIEEEAIDSAPQTKQPFASPPSSASATTASARQNTRNWDLDRFRPKRLALAAAEKASENTGRVDGDNVSASSGAGRSSKRAGRHAGVDLYGEDVMSGVMDDLKQLAPPPGESGPLMLTRQEKNVMHLLHEQLTTAILSLTKQSESSLADDRSATATTTTSQQLLGANNVKLSLSEYELARALTHLQAENQRMKTRLLLLDNGTAHSPLASEGLRRRSDTGFTRDSVGLNSPSSSTVATEHTSSMLQLLAEVKHAFSQHASSRQTLGALLLSQATLITPQAETGAAASTESVSLDELKACIQEVKARAHRLHRQRDKYSQSDAAQQMAAATFAEMEEQYLQAKTDLEQAQLKLSDYDQLCIQVQVWKEKCHKLNARYMSEVTQLAAENETMVRELSDKASTIEAMKKHLAAAEAFVVNAPASNGTETITQQSETHAAAMEAMQQKLDHANRQLQSALQEALANKRVEQERDEQINDLNSLIQHLREENERLTADVAVASKSATSEKELRLKVRQLETQLAEAKSRLDTMLRKEHEMLQKEQQAAELASVNARIQAEVEELRLENRTMMEAKVTSTRLQQANDALRNRVKALENFKLQAEEYKAKFTAISQDLQTAENQLEQTPVLMAEVARLRGQLTALSAVLSDKSDQIEQLKKSAPLENGNGSHSGTPFVPAIQGLVPKQQQPPPQGQQTPEQLLQQQEDLRKANEELQQKNEELSKYVEQVQQQQQEIQTLREQLAEAKRRNRTNLLKQAFLDHTLSQS